MKSCWGESVMSAANDAKDAGKVQTKIVAGILLDGSIMMSFECKGKGKGKVKYSHWQHTHAETR